MIEKIVGWAIDHKAIAAAIFLKDKALYQHAVGRHQLDVEQAAQDAKQEQLRHLHCNTGL